MEVDRLLYIFGSFSRKKQDKRKSLQHQSLSAGSSPLHRNSHAGNTLNIAPRTSAYEDKEKRKSLKEWDCGLCGSELVEPRLLGCLHSFCTRCLQGLHQEGESEQWSAVDVDSIQLEPGGSRTGSGAGSAGSGYESELRDQSGSEGSWETEKPHKHGIFTRKISGKSVQMLVCPTCGYETALPLGGIAALPLNYVLLRKMEKRGEAVAVLCDLCDTDSKAAARCSQCPVSVCSACGARHERQARHELRALSAAPPRYCAQHPRAPLSVYCASCHQVICRECCIIAHSGHALSAAARAAAERARLVRDAAERARFVPDHVERLTRALALHEIEIDKQAARVETEVCSFAEQYRRAVEAHTRALRAAAARARQRAAQRSRRRARDLAAAAGHAQRAVHFAEELLSSARDEELLSLSGPVLRQLERVCDLGTVEETACPLRFAPAAPAGGALVGRLLTSPPDPAHCRVHTEGLQDLQVDVPHETTVELRDAEGERVWCGGEQVAGYFRRRDCAAAPALATVSDHRDGTYRLAFCPTSPGAYLLAVTVNNKPIKGSPFPCAVRLPPAHWGQFHCCSFCSSGGKKDAVCGCGSVMGGGYKGCGHGHTDHPGVRHWSCCGSTAPRGPCLSPRGSAPRRHSPRTYQVSL